MGGLVRKEYTITPSMNELKGMRIHISGIVQGVGFRPFVYSLASQFHLNGWVQNTSAGVDIEVDGTEEQLKDFIDSLKNGSPPLAQIDSIDVQITSLGGFSTFKIIQSEPIPGAFMPISPDVSICDDCLQELFTPENIRYRYPFINCTNCGPRFTIIEDIPYDRPNTTMSVFEMCDICRAQYDNPLDRRFHAQPIACPQCGPQVWLETNPLLDPAAKPVMNSTNNIYGDDAILKTQQLLIEGKILAIKGLGGFHLACDATNNDAVIKLRHRKLRVDKPFAIMMPDIKTVEKNCYLNQEERQILLSRQRPIVLLRSRPNSAVVNDVAPYQNTLGVMLPYTPLHYLLFAEDYFKDNKIIPPTILVMTSGNLAEEPIAIQNQEARERLNSLADAFLMHNREIHTRCDDSVVRQINRNFIDGLDNKIKKYFYPIRRSRGYAPQPISLIENAPQILATGPELKNTFCFTKGKYAFLSQHIGDMENYETLQSFEEGIIQFEKLFRLKPEAIAYDLHPNYLATRYALQRAKKDDIPAFGIQHHHAHINACMADNQLIGKEPVIGISFDGTGYGDDGAIWGGEFLISDYQGYQRFAHLEYFPLPGGDSATRKPLRIALSQLWSQNISWDSDLPPVLEACGDDLSLLRSMLEHKISTPQTSSMGRFFDSIAALIGIRFEVNYEAQAAIELETMVDSQESGFYPLPLENGILKIKPLLNAVISDLRYHTPLPVISARFHNSLGVAVQEVCIAIKNQYDINRVALSGGVWQNMTLLNKTILLLEKSGFEVFTHHQVPTNDGGLALGQAVFAVYKLNGKIK